MAIKLQLTFDDGPRSDRGNALVPILSELKKRKLAGGFFVLGQEVEQDPAATKQIVEAGHVLGNHSWDHLEPHASSYTDDQIRDQFKKCHSAVLKATGVNMIHWRAPRLDQDGGRLPRLLTGPGNLYSLSHCDIAADSKDSRGAKTADEMLASIRHDLALWRRSEGRLLFHVKLETADALKAVLDGLLKDGHSFIDFGQATFVGA